MKVSVSKCIQAYTRIYKAFVEINMLKQAKGLLKGIDNHGDMSIDQALQNALRNIEFVINRLEEFIAKYLTDMCLGE